MASSFSVAAEGRRVTVRVTPMQPLSAIIAAAAAALSPPVADPSTCVLKVNGKVLTPVELGTPIRFANLSAATAKLELVTGRERGLGVAGGIVEKRSEEMTGSMATAGPSSSAAAAAAAAVPPPQAAVQPPAPVMTMPAPPAVTKAAAGAAGGAGPSSSVALPPAAAAPTAPTAAAPPPPPPLPLPRPAPTLPPRAPLPPPPKPVDPAVVIEASVRTHLSATGGGGVVAGFLGLEEGDVAVFSRDDLERAAEAARGGVPLDALASPSSTPDSFFEFTPEDYRAVLGSYRGKHEVAASAPLKTSQQRAAEAAARAVAAGDVRLRVHFLDRSILQFRLPAMAPLGVLREVVSRALERRNGAGGGEGGGGGASTSSIAPSSNAPSSSSSNLPANLAPWEWEIYTAPPKTVLRPADDAKETLFSLGLSPAANIHCGPATATAKAATAPKEAPRLRPELLALRRSGVIPGAAERESKREEEEAKAGGGGAGGSAAGRSGGAAAAASNDKGKGKAGMPKWMKMGK